MLNILSAKQEFFNFTVNVIDNKPEIDGITPVEREFEKPLRDRFGITEEKARNCIDRYFQSNYTDCPMNIFDSDRGPIWPIWPRSESVNRFLADDPECGADFQFLTVFGADF